MATQERMQVEDLRRILETQLLIRCLEVYIRPEHVQPLVPGPNIHTVIHLLNAQQYDERRVTRWAVLSTWYHIPRPWREELPQHHRDRVTCFTDLDETRYISHLRFFLDSLPWHFFSAETSRDSFRGWNETGEEIVPFPKILGPELLADFAIAWSRLDAMMKLPAPGNIRVVVEPARNRLEAFIRQQSRRHATVA